MAIAPTSAWAQQERAALPREDRLPRVLRAPTEQVVICDPQVGQRMTRTNSFTLLLVLAAALHPLVTSAQEQSCLGIRCRGHAHFLTCDRPREGATVVSAHVIAVSRECSNEILSMRIDDAKARDLPAIIEVNLGGCISFAGQVGDLIRVALFERPRPDRKRYRFACNVW